MAADEPARRLPGHPRRRQGQRQDRRCSKHLLTKADAILIGGAMAYTFLKAQGMRRRALRAWRTNASNCAATSCARPTSRGVRFLLPSRPYRRHQDRAQHHRAHHPAGRRDPRRDDGAGHRPGDRRGLPGRDRPAPS
ncbi:MAG: phosphoglycerate kinase [Desulfosudis oleivorans]|nr:phosphoglycerate kinase [Desulfosudis oleivorans]